MKFAGRNMINLNKLENNFSPEKNSAPQKKKTITWLTVFFVLAIIAFSGKAFFTKQKSDSWVYKVPLISDIKRLAESANNPLKGEERDRVNILLLGTGGKGHDGPNLTDTIMVASFQPSSKKVAMLSIPRDLSVPLENQGWRKINNVNAYAESANPGSGGLATSQTVSDILNIPIDYYVRVDFDGFVNIIDELGGIDVKVENNLEDYRYPILGKEEAEPFESRYEHLYIEKGEQEMDGELALKFVRSRHASGVEGTDFARARRQQLVLEAIKEKFLSKNTLFRPSIVTNIYNQLQEHVSTNLQIWEILKLWDMFKDTPRENIINKVLDNSPSGLLVDSAGIDGAYLLLPRNGDFTEVQYLAQNIFSNQTTAETKPKNTTEKATVEVRNGTWINGLANRKALDIEAYGLNVIRVGNASRQNFERTVIYDLSFGEKPKALAILKEKTDANVSAELPDWLKEDIAKASEGQTNYARPDFLIIIGQDADTNNSGTANPEN